MLDAFVMRLFCRFKLGRDSCMTCTALTISADRTADRNHGQSSQPNAVRPQAHQLDRICCRADATVCPEFHFFAQTCLGQGALRIHDADLSRESYVSERMRARRTRASIVPGKADDIRICFGDTDSDDADARHNRYFDRNACFGVDGLKLFDELSKV